MREVQNNTLDSKRSKKAIINVQYALHVFELNILNYRSMFKRDNFVKRFT